MGAPLLEMFEKVRQPNVELKEFLRLLTGVEQSVLNVLLYNDQAMNPNEIRLYLVADVVNTITCLFEKEICEKLFEQGKRRKLPWYWKGVLSPPLNPKPFFDFVKKHKPLAKYINDYVKFLKKEDIAAIPDYRTIEKILKEFEVAGIVISRDEVGKAKKAYAINPLIAKELKEST